MILFDYHVSIFFLYTSRICLSSFVLCRFELWQSFTDTIDILFANTALVFHVFFFCVTFLRLRNSIS
jgi:hypothetical protein